jgi:hypothetical protein
MRRLSMLVAVLVSAAAFAADTMYPVPTGAIDVGHHVLQPGVYEEDHFFLTERYPGNSALTHYEDVFSHWQSCHGPSEGWQSFGDASGSEKVFIHQLLRYWVNPQNDVALTLVLRYESPGLATREAPSSDRQFVALMRLRLRPGEAAKHLAPMGVKCAKGT